MARQAAVSTWLLPQQEQLQPDHFQTSVLLGKCLYFKKQRKGVLLL